MNSNFISWPKPFHSGGDKLLMNHEAGVFL